MEKHQFKTNINCSGCVANVTPHLSGNEKIRHWEVDTNNPKKILTVEAEGLSEEEIKAIVQKAGFKAESI
ncbi:MAG TPA: heavy-metal-associated domain-containing protein [Chitinophagaceae bacterium]